MEQIVSIHKPHERIELIFKSSEIAETCTISYPGPESFKNTKFCIEHIVDDHITKVRIVAGSITVLEHDSTDDVYESLVGIVETIKYWQSQEVIESTENSSK